ncbi:urea ABC transporter ATP-binding subunit UrtE [Shimia abyssi]|uniref:Amino acid/amide ABC transporter ATP-binding protein 2 (HAAT family) n=1 Tax=Shimia abyssi TaxID=1662395 RepID=A0A2P8FHK8_9RHOB|nr:urea ABC transporter ATP-binding subunit UrtE [Shimia abyssi]PSL21213.1 amino acid/amide ABC transporter ATP-binding protein 2 (HAAT family) [Shimia abyssi]
MLKIDNLNLHYGSSQILHDISLQAELGKTTCVMGTNGVGKTSLLKAISGTHTRSSGSITINGKPIDVLPAHAMAQLGVGYVPQGRDVFPLLTVRENLETGYACLPKSEHFIPDEIFELFPILQDFLHRRGGDLSGGQQQQLAIARALITKPKLLLLDEPTEGIQPNIIKQIGKVIDYLRDRGDMAIILVEQFFDFAYDHADSFVILRRGAVVKSGTSDSLSRQELLEAVSV